MGLLLWGVCLFVLLRPTKYLLSISLAGGPGTSGKHLWRLRWLVDDWQRHGALCADEETFVHNRDSGKWIWWIGNESRVSCRSVKRFDFCEFRILCFDISARPPRTPSLCLHLMMSS